MATLKNIVTVGGGSVIGSLGTVAVTGALEDVGAGRPMARTAGPVVVAFLGLLLVADGFFRPGSSFAGEKAGVGGGVVVGAVLTTFQI